MSSLHPSINNMDNRIAVLDYIRAFCMLYIIGVWHLNNYLPPTLHFSSGVYRTFEAITVAILSTFTFLSGYLLRKYEFNTATDIWYFYKKRILRFWPLFFVSSMTLYLMHWMNTKQLLLGITGLTMFSPPPAKTLWYISMLMFFYAITPLVRWKKKKGDIDLSSLFAPLVVFFSLLLFCLLGAADNRLVVYSPVYLIGLLSKDLSLNRRQWTLLFTISFVICVVLSAIFHNMYLIRNICISLTGCLCLVSGAFIIVSKLRPTRLVVFLVYGSMTAYLFHRQIFGVVLYFLGNNESGESFLPLWLAIITLIILFFAAWVLQYIYDYLLKKIDRSF